MKIKLLDKRAILPRRADNGSAGYDLCYLSHEVQINNSSVMIHTGISIEIPEGYVGLLFARSSSWKKYGMMLTNSVGVIDSSYRGEIMISCKLANIFLDKFAIGQPIAQLVVVPYLKEEIEVVNELSETSRGKGGFGSSDR